MADREAYYVAARGGFNRDGSVRVALLAGPYPTSKEAEAMVGPVSRWSSEHSGDNWAVFYEYGVASLPAEMGISSRLGAVTPDSGLLSGVEYAAAATGETPDRLPGRPAEGGPGAAPPETAAELARRLFGGGHEPEPAPAEGKRKGWVERILEERSGEGSGGGDSRRERLRSLHDDQRQQQREDNDRGGRGR
jgi:hypothetical protein